MSALSQRVVNRLRDAHGITIPADAHIDRIPGGWAVKARGAWSWSIMGDEHATVTYGSQWPASQLVKCRDWTVEGPQRHTPDRSIEPCRVCAEAWSSSPS